MPNSAAVTTITNTPLLMNTLVFVIWRLSRKKPPTLFEKALEQLGGDQAQKDQIVHTKT